MNLTITEQKIIDAYREVGVPYDHLAYTEAMDRLCRHGWRVLPLCVALSGPTQCSWVPAAICHNLATNHARTRPKPAGNALKTKRPGADSNCRPAV